MSPAAVVARYSPTEQVTSDSRNVPRQAGRDDTPRGLGRGAGSREDRALLLGAMLLVTIPMQGGTMKRGACYATRRGGHGAVGTTRYSESYALRDSFLGISGVVEQSGGD
jgi:hypothetical protein